MYEALHRMFRAASEAGHGPASLSTSLALTAPPSHHHVGGTWTSTSGSARRRVGRCPSCGLVRAVRAAWRVRKPARRASIRRRPLTEGRGTAGAALIRPSSVRRSSSGATSIPLSRATGRPRSVMTTSSPALARASQSSSSRRSCVIRPRPCPTPTPLGRADGAELRRDGAPRCGPHPHGLSGSGPTRIPRRASG
jgi:hypothetical protein